MKRKNIKEKYIKKVLSGLLIAGVLVAAVGCGKSAESDSASDGSSASAESDASEDQTETSYEGVVIRIADSEDGTKFSLADELGYWDEEFSEDGIEVEGSYIANGTAFIDAVSTDQVDIGIFGDQPAISAFASGKGVKIIGRFADDTIGYALYAREGSGIESGADLKGKKIAYTAGQTSEKIVKQILEAENISWDEVEGINLSSADGITALRTGDVDALIGTQYTTAQITNGYEVAPYSDYGRSIHVIIASTAFLEKYPELAARILQVYAKEAEWAEENAEDAIQYFIDHGQVSQEQAETVYYGETRGVGYTDSDTEVLNGTAKFLYEAGITSQLVTAEDFVDTQYLEMAGLLDE